MICLSKWSIVSFGPMERQQGHSAAGPTGHFGLWHSRHRPGEGKASWCYYSATMMAICNTSFWHSVSTSWWDSSSFEQKLEWHFNQSLSVHRFWHVFSDHLKLSIETLIIPMQIQRIPQKIGHLFVFPEVGCPLEPLETRLWRLATRRNFRERVGCDHLSERIRFLMVFGEQFVSPLFPVIFWEKTTNFQLGWSENTRPASSSSRLEIVDSMRLGPRTCAENTHLEPG